MIIGDQLAIAKETGRRLGMGINMYPSSSLLGHNNDEHEAIPVDELIEMADGFAGVFPEHKYEIVKFLQEMKHVVGMTGDGVNDAPALKKPDIGIVVADATNATRSSADIVLTEPGLSVIISAVLTSRAIFQRMKNYTLGFTLLAGFVCVWKHKVVSFEALDTGNYSWRSEVVTRKTRILDMAYIASNNEFVRTQTLVKSAIVQVDVVPFK